ncbi:hypothetical protein [Mycoplasma todarodis]|uniref:hypothetical protein n=1 Tax=Mycoplasma todarodis TaxID=1937191 RepID=UPI003B2E0358
MKKKYKVVLKSSALVAVSAIGVSTVAVACGETDSKKEVKSSHHNRRRRRHGSHRVITEGQHVWRFAGAEYATKELADKARNKLINEKFEEARKTALVKDFEIDGKSFKTKTEFVDYLKKEYEVKETYFKKDAFKEVENFGDIKNKYVDIIDGLEFKGKKYSSIKEFVKASGDGTGNFYVQEKYAPKEFNMLNEVKKGNFIFKSGGTKPAPEIKTLNDLDKFKKELTRVVTEIFNKSEKWRDGYDTIDATRLVLGDVKSINLSTGSTPLYKGRDGNYWLFANATISDGKKVTSKSLLSIIKENVKTMDDVKTIWNLISSNNFKLTSKGFLSPSTWEKSLNALSNDGTSLENYKTNSSKWNVLKHFEVNKKFFKTKKAAEAEVDKFTGVKEVSIKPAELKLLKNLSDLKSLVKQKGVTKLMWKDGSISSTESKTNTDIVETINKKLGTSWVVNNEILNTKAEAVAKARELASNDKTSSNVLINIDTLTPSTNAKSKVGRNFKTEEVSKMLKNPQTFKDIKSKSYIKQTDGTLLEVNKNNFKKGFVVVKKTRPDAFKKTKDKVFFVKHSIEQILFEGVKFQKNNNGEALYNYEGKQLNLKDFRSKFEETFNAKNSMYIDEMILNSKGRNYFENYFKFPETRVIGSDKMAVIDTPKIGVVKINGKDESKDEITMYIRHGKNGFWSKKTNIIGIQNDDEIKIVIRKSDSSYTRIIKVNNLKRNVIDFFKNFKNGDGTPDSLKDKKAIQAMIDGFEQIGKDLLADLKFNLKNLLEVAKKYMSTDVDKRDRKEFADAFHRIHNLLDERFFDEIATNKDSIANRVIETLVNNGVDASMISNDNKTLKPELKALLDDALDIIKVFIDDSFNFIEHSLYWKPEWLDASHLVNAKSANADDKAFFDKLTKGKLIENSGDADDKKDAAFQTVKKLMNGNLKVYKETTANGEVLYHVVKDVNSRVISNTFKGFLEHSKVDHKGTLDNLRLNPKDNKLEGVLAAAKKRKSDNHYEEDAKKIYQPKKSGNPKSSDGKAESNSKSPLDAILKLLKGDDIKNLIPVIKGILNSQSLEGLLNLGEGAVDSKFGLSGLGHLENIFNSITGSLSTGFISAENNLQGLLTRLIGEKGNVVMSFAKDSDGNFILKDYKSPQITTVDKDNRDTIIYRKDKLDVLFKKLKPLIDLGLILAGSL